MRRRLLLPLVLLVALPLVPASAAPVPAAQVRDTDPVVMTGADFPAWAAPADVALDSGSVGGAMCQGGVDEEACTNNTYEDPEVSTQEVAQQSGVPVERLVGYRWHPQARKLVQVPFQVDERFVRYLSNNASGFAFYSETDQHTAYAFDREGFRWTASDPSDPCLARPASPVAKDPVQGLDTDDELVFMARDLGPQAPADAELPKHAQEMVEVVVASSGVGAGVQGYLYVVLAGDKGPRAEYDATNGYVRYERDADADVFLYSQSSYSDYGAAPKGPWYDPSTKTCRSDKAEWRQHRPGDQATISTPRYQFRYDGRWLMTQLRVSPNADWKYGPDLVDQWKARAFQQRPGGQTPCCGYEEEVNNWGGSSILMGERVGPVRAIRETWGADSGTNVVRREIFYRDEVHQGNFLRVHVIPPLDGIYAQWDYNAGVMTRYFNPYLEDGVAIDGRNDEAFGNSRVHVGPDGASYEGDDTVSDEIEAAAGGGPVEVGSPNEPRCESGLPSQADPIVDEVEDGCVYNDVDTADPTFSGPTGTLNWEQVAGPYGSLVMRTTLTQVNPGGAAATVATIPYYRDDACFDDGTGSSPGPHVRSRGVDDGPYATYQVEVSEGVFETRPRECWDAAKAAADPAYRADTGTRRFFQGSIGTHGLHILLIADSDNARTTVPVTEIVTNQRIVVLPPTLANVGEQYGRGFEQPLVARAVPRA